MAGHGAMSPAVRLALLIGAALVNATAAAEPARGLGPASTPASGSPGAPASGSPGAPATEPVRVPVPEPPARRTTSVDGAYGRLEGDVAPGFEAGASLGPSSTAVLQGRLLYLATAGLQASWFAPRHGKRSTVSVGAEVRPLFLGRFLTDREQGPAWLDLLLDSLHLGLAARLGGGQHAGLDLSAGVELPLSRSFSGFYLGLTGLWSLPHRALVSSSNAQGQALLTIGFRSVLGVHVVDANDKVLR